MASRRLERCVVAGGLAIGVVLAALRAGAAPGEDEWHSRYARAKAMLVEGHPTEAARELEALAADAPSTEDATLARELATVARASSRKEPGPDAPHIRTSDELSVLYASAFIYGLGTSGWVVLLTQPGNFGAALVPFVGITGAAVGGVAFVDSYKPFRRGVPHSIAAGLYLGLGEGIWVVGLQHAGATRRDDDSRWGASSVATVFWTGATAGGVVGGLVGALREPTPGRVSFTSSAGTWLGLSAGFFGAAFEPRDRSRTEAGFLVGGIGYNVGILTGIAIAPSIAPSVARVRFIDLGAIAGGLVGGGLYAVTADKNANVPAGLGSAAAGMVAGVGLSWWLTDGMPKDPPEAPKPGVAWRPLVTPTLGGCLFGVSGEL
ncbi:MAG TPA: hypothetical protein VGQ57_20750 [Polyangiaceae bacterium]|jgi:hypothetical protein|nr:hypothetical protein [Polyangiaceae bacterium]